MALVVDASITAAWALTDETSPMAERAMDRLLAETALVPGIWWFEVRNVLLMSERRKRATEEQSNSFLKQLKLLPIWTDSDPEESSILGLARKYQLTFYDAAYLEVALRNRLPLATLNRALSAAAQAVGVSLLR